MDNLIDIKQLEMSHIKLIIKALGDSDVYRSEDYLNLCHLENELNKRITLLAFYDKEFAGYINILLNSKYPFFFKNRIPEISDFFVLPKYRKHGIGTALLDAAEELISKDYGRNGLGVGVYKDFEPNHNMYIRNGYTANVLSNAIVGSGDNNRVDDEFLVYMYKKLL